MRTEQEMDNIIETSPGDEDLMLPEGYGAEDDVFADSQNRTGTQADEPADRTGDGKDGTDDGEEDAPTTAQDTAQDVSGSDTAQVPTTEPAAPTTAQDTAKAAPNMLKFRAKYDSQERDVELNESDLPGIWQKAQNHDRMQSRFNEQQATINELERIAKSLGYASPKEMVEKASSAFLEAEIKSMTDNGVPERVAKAVVAQEMAQRGTVQNAPAPQSAAPAQRNYGAEISELLTAHPELRGQQIPSEVFAAANGGKNLLLAYTEHESRKAAAETQRSQQAESIRKQNEENAAKAPVKGAVLGGNPKDEKGEDDFLRGFNEDY